MTRETLDRLTDDLIADLATSPDLLEALVAESGLVPHDLRLMARDAPLGLAAALIDFITRDDARLTGFAARSGWPADRVDYARQALDAGAFGTS